MLTPTVPLVEPDAGCRFVFSSLLRRHGRTSNEARDAGARPVVARTGQAAGSGPFGSRPLGA